ncbi:MAG TPA: ABC transporter permease [Caulobacterales bacterium]|nr:ABC transporter permease [Caulobacterales bacterium]
MSLALSTLIYEWRRYMAAVVALSAAGVLVLGLSGLFVGLISGYTATIDRSRADIMILPPDAKSLLNSGGLPARIMPLVYLQPNVTEVRDLDGDWGRFYGPGKKDASNVNASIIDPIPGAVTLPTDFPETARQALSIPFNIAVDRTALNRLGVKLNDEASFNGHIVRVAAVLDGYPNVDNPGIIMSRQTLRLMGHANTTRLGPLMVKVGDPAQAAQVRDQLNAIADHQYRAWTKDELRAATLNEFLNDGIIAVMMWASVILGLFVGIIITWQTLRGAILANVKEFASLRALGVSMGSLRIVVLELSFWVGIAGLALTAVLMVGITLLAKAGGVLIGFMPNWVVIACIMLMMIAMLSGTFSLGVLKQSQPADLLR